MEGTDGRLNPAVNGQTLGERWKGDYGMPMSPWETHINYDAAIVVINGILLRLVPSSNQLSTDSSHVYCSKIIQV